MKYIFKIIGNRSSKVTRILIIVIKASNIGVDKFFKATVNQMLNIWSVEMLAHKWGE